jgi:hypothetical protein
MKPIDRYALDRSRIRYMPNINVNDEIFYVEQDRTVINTNSFSFCGFFHKGLSLCNAIEVELPVTRQPPHRSRHAELPHRALQEYSHPQNP